SHSFPTRRSSDLLFAFGAKAVFDEFLNHFIGRIAGYLELIQRLQGGKARGAAFFVTRIHGAEVNFVLSCISATQARAASPPLSRPSELARSIACSSLSTVRM